MWVFDFLDGIIMFEFTNHGEAQAMADNVKKYSLKMKEYNELIAAKKE